MNEQKERENALKKALRSAGYSLLKADSRAITRKNRGQYLLIDTTEHVAIMGLCYSAPLEEVEAWARNRGIIP